MSDLPIRRAALLLLPIFAAGCMPCPGVQSEAEVRREVIVASQAQRLVGRSGNGEILVRPSTRAGEVQVVAAVVGIGRDADHALEVRERIELDCGVRDGAVVVGWKWTLPPADCESGQVRFEITAPVSWALDLESSNGDLAVDGVGDRGVELETGNGDIRVTGVVGDIVAGSSNGSVEVAAPAARVDLSSGNGSIQFDARGDGPLGGRVRSGNGDVTVSVGTRAALVVATTGNGELHLDERMTPLGAGRAKGVFGDEESAGQLVIETGNGAVTVRED